MFLGGPEKDHRRRWNVATGGRVNAGAVREAVEATVGAGAVMQSGPVRAWHPDSDDNQNIIQVMLLPGREGPMHDAFGAASDPRVGGLHRTKNSHW